MVVKNNVFYFGLFILLFLVTFCYTYFISFLNLDEIWNYGFSYNISCGLVPYRDFNMLQTPLLFFIGSIFINIFGNHLWSVHIFNSLFVSFMMLILYKRIHRKIFILYPIMLIYSVYSYNIFCLFLGMLILIILDKKIKYNDYYIAFLVSLIFLSKQNIGFCLLIPMMFYSKNKIKSFIIFIIPVVLLCIYLIINNAFYDFINYSFLGMFDFGKSNGVYYFIVFYLILCFYLLYQLVKSNFKNKHLFYILAFQIVGFPIVDDYHFMIGFILFLYYLLSYCKISEYKIKYLIVISFSFFIIYLFNAQLKLDNYSFENISLYSDKSSYLYGRNFGLRSQKLLGEISNYVINNREEYKDNIYLFANWAYLVRLNLNQNPGKYDFILNGNMGYRGDEKIIDELEDRCMNEKCLFILQLGGNQVNMDILNYVAVHYEKIDEMKDIDHKYVSKVNTNYMIYSNVKMVKS